MSELTLRRTRLSGAARELARTVRIAPGQFIQPLFVVQGLARREAVDGLTDVYRETPDSLLAQVESDLAAGIDKFLLFGVPAGKHPNEFDHAFAAAQVAAVKARFGADAWLATDVCLCSYTSHGHCGVLTADGREVDNAASVAALANAALLYAQAGADCVAPSDMMDGRVGAIRATLAAQGHDDTVLMSYAAKFHSAFYGPFRNAANSAPAGDAGPADRASYQLDPARPREALASALRDAEEGADMLMVKPALPYLDVLAELARAIPLPFAAYQTSGEQAGIDLAAASGLGNADSMQVETWTAMARAGASALISYAARRAPALLGAGR